jgi:hypothetical protein
VGARRTTISLIDRSQSLHRAWLVELRSCDRADMLRTMMNPKLETVGNDSKVKDSLACEHPSTESLGFNSNVRFSRCQECGYVLVRSGQRTWAVPPAQSAP